MSEVSASPPSAPAPAPSADSRRFAALATGGVAFIVIAILVGLLLQFGLRLAASAAGHLGLGEFFLTALLFVQLWIAFLTFQAAANAGRAIGSEVAKDMDRSVFRGVFMVLFGGVLLLSLSSGVHFVDALPVILGGVAGILKADY